MDSDELAQRYAAGERDFRGINLAGATLNKIDLS